MLSWSPLQIIIKSIQMNTLVGTLSDRHAHLQMDMHMLRAHTHTPHTHHTHTHTSCIRLIVVQDTASSDLCLAIYTWCACMKNLDMKNAHKCTCVYKGTHTDTFAFMRICTRHRHKDTKTCARASVHIQQTHSVN